MTSNITSANSGFTQLAAQEHRAAAHLHEKACKHHYEAARLYEKGDLQQAAIHANLAADHAVNAIETGASNLGP